VTRPTGTRRFAVSAASHSQADPLSASPTAEHGARGRALREGSASALRNGSTTAGRVRRADPAAMSEEARIGELGEILAMGYRRVQMRLARSADPEAVCESMVDAHNSEHAEDAR
jgi:hypothetical protein